VNKREPAVSVRAADPDRDLSAIIALNRFVQDIHVAVEPSLFRQSRDMPGIEDFHLGFIKNEDHYTFVAEVGADLVGYVGIELQRRPANPFTNARNRLYVHQVGVHPRHRRHGVGRALMSTVDALANQLGVSEVSLDAWSFNADALSFFESLGYAAFNVRLRKTDL
jgi:ribosomal protein S18 acetylase RimI-like enzyme